MTVVEQAGSWEEQRALHQFDDHAPAYCVHERFLSIAQQAPDAPALRSLSRTLTYAELNQFADTFADALQRRGVAPGTCVAICADRSIEMVVALLGILKAGAAYVPIVASYPSSRIEFMLADPQAEVVVVQGSYAALLPPGVEQLLLDEALSFSPATPAPVSCSPQDRAYVMYTSGSTGTPKGAEIPHRAIERLTGNENCVPLGPGQVMLHAAPIAFDASTIEVWGPLLGGGTVALYPDAIPTAAGLGACIRQLNVTALWLTAALFNMVIDQDPAQLSPLKYVVTGGEALSVAHVRRALSALPSTQLVNGYGPTETTTFATCYPIPRTLSDEATAIPIGRAIRQTRLYCLDAERNPVEKGAVGELYIGGFGLALGYLNRPELTEVAFVDDPLIPGEKMYRTGDLVRVLPSGDIDYVGRADSQVKIRGFRIEPGEVENAISNCTGVKASAVVARTTSSGDKRLVAYVVPSSGPVSEMALREELGKKLPDYMVPSVFVPLEALPITTNGKLDYRALPAPTMKRPELPTPYLAPSTEFERQIALIWADLLDLDEVGVHDNFFELGGNSLMAVKAAALIERETGRPLRVVKMFELPTVALLAGSLEGDGSGTDLRRRLGKRRLGGKKVDDSAIAIIGMAGRFPGSIDPRTLWANLCEGREGISFFTPEEIDELVPEEFRNDPNYVPARGIMQDYELFEPAFFGVTPAEAALMDPQQRVILEIAWNTLEDAGYVPRTFDGTIGIYAGKYNDTYFSEVVMRHPDAIESFGAFNTMLANEKDYVATRTAYALDLRGPAVSIHTACSTSLVCIVQAVHSLRTRQCDLALAGGVSITVPVKNGYLHQEGAMLSPDGHTRTFSDQAGGTVFSDGAAMVLLKRLPEALEDGDQIYAVVRGVAMNNDGRNKASLTAPSVEGQAIVVAEAQADAGVSADEIGYIEAHGTGTKLGDPVEMEALKKAFALGTERVGYCGVGSVKSNLGHTVIAAGATGVIKAALSLKNELIPKSLGYERPNPEIDFEGSPFYVTSENTPWPRAERPRYAGVSAFGVGGTNAHVVLEEPPVRAPSAPSSRGYQLLVLSARTEVSLRKSCENLANFLDAHPEAPLSDVAFTLHAGRESFPLRATVVAKSADDAKTALRSQKLRVTRSKGRPPKVAFLFPGQGSQYPRMGQTLYQESPTFRAHFDRCAYILRPLLGRELTELVFAPGQDLAAAEEVLKRTEIAQPALFAIEYSLARLLETWGIEPAFSMGHSVGEFVSATLAGVMDLEDALPLVASRGRMMQEQAAGAMLSVRAGSARVEPLLAASLCIASDNAPDLCVVSGPAEDVEALRQQLEGENIPCRALVTSHAFHSSMMDPVTEPFRELVSKITLRAPKVPFVSTATGTWITDEQAKDPNYWAQHLRLPVLFSQGLTTLLKESNIVLFEVGPRAVLGMLAQQHKLDRESQIVLSTLGNDDDRSWDTLLSAVGRLFELGARLNPAFLHGPEARRRISLPTYAFDRARFWLDPARARESDREQAAVAGSTARAPAAVSSVAASPVAVPSVAVPSVAASSVTASPASGQVGVRPVRPMIESQLALMRRQLELLQSRRR
jgi:amino acid adenylation domain-containing protein